MTIYINPNKTPEDRIFILQCYQNKIITKEEARAMLLVMGS